MTITWFGHSAFRLDFDGRATAFPHIQLTHGHSDHVGDATTIAKKTGRPVRTFRWFDFGIRVSRLTSPGAAA